MVVGKRVFEVYVGPSRGLCVGGPTGFLGDVRPVDPTEREVEAPLALEGC